MSTSELVRCAITTHSGVDAQGAAAEQKAKSRKQRAISIFIVCGMLCWIELDSVMVPSTPRRTYSQLQESNQTPSHDNRGNEVTSRRLNPTSIPLTNQSLPMGEGLAEIKHQFIDFVNVFFSLPLQPWVLICPRVSLVPLSLGGENSGS